MRKPSLIFGIKALSSIAVFQSDPIPFMLGYPRSQTCFFTSGQDEHQTRWTLRSLGQVNRSPAFIRSSQRILRSPDTDVVVVYQDEFSFNDLSFGTPEFPRSGRSTHTPEMLFISKSKAARLSHSIHFTPRFANAIQTLNASI